MKSNTVPCHSFVPDLVETDTTPAPRPNSAENTPFSTLNSRTDSTDGVTITVLNVYSLLSMPSISQPLVLACWPSALKFDAPRGLNVLAPDRFSFGLTRRHAGHEIHQRREVASVQRQLADRPFLDHRADFRRVRIHQRGARHHRRRFLERAELQLRVDAHARIDLNHDVGVDVFPEALDFDRDFVCAGIEERRGVGAVVVGVDGGGRPLRDVLDGHRRAGHDLPLRVGDRSHQ